MRSLDTFKMASFSGAPLPELPDDLIDELEGHAHPNEIQEPVRIYKYICAEGPCIYYIDRHFVLILFTF